MTVVNVVVPLLVLRRRVLRVLLVLLLVLLVLVVVLAHVVRQLVAFVRVRLVVFGEREVLGLRLR